MGSDATTVPDCVTNFEVKGENNSAILTWKNPIGQSYYLTKIIQKINEAPTSLTDGIEVYSGTGNTVTISDLQPSVNYYFSAFAINKSGKYNLYSSINYKFVFPTKPDSYIEIGNYTNKAEFVAPEDGWFKFYIQGRSGNGGPHYNGGGVEYSDKGGGGGGGGYGTSEGEYPLYKGDIIKIQIENKNNQNEIIRIREMIVKSAKDGSGAYYGSGGKGGAGGTGAGGNIKNTNGTSGKNGNFDYGVFQQTTIYGGIGGSPKGGRGGNAYPRADYWDNEPGISSKIIVYRGNTNIVL